ncbi:MAG: YbaB/EbfC family nucleoid-associated protein [Planctomycetota bacterium]|jgi:hypothetical protein|nr:YbaB/EbfC family nucleoid-associated protein [Planctomycetota bacterium]
MENSPPNNPFDFGQILGKLGGLGGASDLLKQAQDLPAKMKKIKSEASQKTLRVSVGGGAVEIVCRGTGEIETLKIAPSVVDPNSTEELEDLLRAGVNESLRQAREMVRIEMAKATEHLPIPPGMLDDLD